HYSTKPTPARVGFSSSGRKLPVPSMHPQTPPHRSFGEDDSTVPTRRWVLYYSLVLVLSIVSDGWSGKPSPLLHQLLLLPLTWVTAVLLTRLLSPSVTDSGGRMSGPTGLPQWWWVALVIFEGLSVTMMGAEGRHFRSFGYHLGFVPCLAAAVAISIMWMVSARVQRALSLFLAVMVTYAAGLLLAIRCFPLNYLRSDMLPVIAWADGRLLAHLNPYATMHVGERLYDFPYLPGMLIAFWPAAAARVDLRVATLSYSTAMAALIWRTACKERRFQVAALLGVFVLCPFLQYRHDLYLQPHWFLLVVAIVLMQRGQFLWSALVWGMSCAVYQLSWVLVPFVVLHAYRRGGLSEAAKASVLIVSGGFAIAGPFLKAAFHRVSNNTVSQWSRLPHALADPMNFSYWLTYVVRPDQLKWIQAAVLTTMFMWCVARGRCGTLEDTLRWMIWALAIFIPLNVIVDGYFYLTLLLLVLIYVCVANGWWGDTDLGNAPGSLADGSGTRGTVLADSRST
ncbi:MAG TPA: hypothetical protein VKV02_00075, partial [Acidobacteriaceae bacterium]|nr:hypothetical protein [Acidobacteriaceae bacterium]